MPITSSFDPYSAEVITAQQMIRPIADFPDTMIVTFQPRTFDVLLREYQTTPLGNLALEEVSDSTTQSQVVAITHDGRRLAAFLSPVGAPTTVASLEEAIAYGVKKFVVFGSCGALVPDLAAGGLIVPTAAYRDEGTSYHYAVPSDYIKVATSTRTSEILTDMGIPHTAGRVWTTDAFYRETQSNVAKRVAEGCIAVDMETSALAALAQFRSVDIHQFLFAADALTTTAWDPGVLGKLPAEPRARYIRIAADIAVRL